MENLNLYFVVFSVHSLNVWIAHAGYVFAENEEHIPHLLEKAIYGKCHINSVTKVEAEEGLVVYGKLMEDD